MEFFNNSVKYNFSKMREEFLIVLILVASIFLVLDGAGIVQSALKYAVLPLIGNFFPTVFFFIAFVAIMGIFTNSRLPVLSFVFVSGIGILLQGIGLILAPNGGNVLVGTLFFQIICSGIVLLSLSTIYEMEKRTQVDSRWKSEEIESLPALEIRNLEKTYDLGEVKVYALRGVNLSLRRGEFISIMGPSGCGKSTLLNLLGTLDQPSKGQIFVDGVDINRLDDDDLAYLRNKKFGFIFQAYNLIPRMSVIQNVEIPAIVTNIDSRARRQRAIELLTKVGLQDKMYRRPKTLSGGEQQRVAIARALLNSPTILLCDEPTGNLDSKSGAMVMDIISELRREFGVSIIVVTHDPQIAAKTDRIIYLKDGMNAGEKLNIAF